MWKCHSFSEPIGEGSTDDEDKSGVPAAADCDADADDAGATGDAGAAGKEDEVIIDCELVEDKGKEGVDGDDEDNSDDDEEVDNDTAE